MFNVASQSCFHCPQAILFVVTQKRPYGNPPRHLFPLPSGNSLRCDSIMSFTPSLVSTSFHCPQAILFVVTRFVSEYDQAISEAVSIALRQFSSL